MSECQPVLYGYPNQCGGEDISGTIFEQWCQYDCIGTFSNYIYNTKGILSYNPANQLLTQSYVTNLFNIYLQTNVITDNTLASGYSDFQNTLLNLCDNPTTPGICDQFLTGWCSQFTREDAINSPIITSFCGCYVPPDPNYLSYTSEPSGCTTSGPGCIQQPQCDPLCRRSTTVQKSVQGTGITINCPENICVIDEVAISAVNSQIGEGINFTSICPACGGGNSNQCLCIISGVNPSNTLGQVGIGDNIQQFCGSNSVCLIEDTNGNIISEGGCAKFSPSDITIPPIYSGPFIGIVIVMIIILIIAVALLLVTKYK